MVMNHKPLFGYLEINQVIELQFPFDRTSEVNNAFTFKLSI